MAALHTRTRIWWIEKPSIAGSPNPSDAELRLLRRAGFGAIVCLLDPDEQRRAYSTETARQLGYAWHSIPVHDYAAPTLEQFRQFLRIAGEECRRHGVLVHCQAGIGRTGSMATAYWIGRGLPADRAVELVRRARPGAVESEEQLQRLRELERLTLTGTLG